MTTLLLPLALAACAPAMTAVSSSTPARLEVAQPSPSSTAQGLTLSSPSFVNGGTLPALSELLGAAAARRRCWALA